MLTARLARIATSAAIVVGVFGIFGAGACTGPAPARGQLVVFVDSDVRLVSELATRDDVSSDAAMDTLRVDVLDDENSQYDIQTFIVSQPSSWPLSFGVAYAGESSRVRLRFRLFRAQFASSDVVVGQGTLDPPLEVTIDRLVQVAPPASGVQHVRVVLAEDCMGTPANLGSEPATCIDALHLAADPSEGIESLDSAPPATTVETWGPAVTVPCQSTPGAGEVCIPGGFAILGDLNDIGNAPEPAYEPVPLRPLIASPFLIDKLEFTVGRLRALVQAGTFTGALPTPNDPGDPTNRYCEWLGADDASNDAYPVNCVTYAAAAEACNAVHGQLPTEAQWEYMARGRGQQRQFPWGSAQPQCCTVSASRAGPVSVAYAPQCPGSGLEPVGSHPVSAACADAGDVSRDGVFDLAGSVFEGLLDDFQGYDAPCWTSRAILHDPVCKTSSEVSPSARGGVWDQDLRGVTSSLREQWGTVDSGSVENGFRCAYVDGP